jgi:hypothetical protein
MLWGKHAVIAAACRQERGTFALALKELGIERGALAERGQPAEIRWRHRGMAGLRLGYGRLYGYRRT